MDAVWMPGKRNQTTTGMTLQAVVLNESRVSQYIDFEPWDPDPEPIHTYSEGALQHIACFTPEGGMAMTDGVEYQCFFDCTLLITPDPAPNIGSERNMEIRARFRARYLAEERISDNDLLTFAETGAWLQVQPVFFQFAETVCQYAGLGSEIEMPAAPCSMQDNPESLIFWDEVVDLPPL